MLKDLKRKKRKRLFLIVFIMWVVFSVMAVQAWQKPLVQEEISQENPITWTSNYDYVVEVSPCTLYPEGGVRTADEAIFPAVTRKINVFLQTEFNAGKPITAEGTYQIMLQLSAENLWTRTFPLTGEKSFQVKGTKGKIIKEEIVLDLGVIEEYLAQVEAETGNSKRMYHLAVKPELTGTLTYNKETIPLSGDGELRFVYESNAINPEGERNFSTDLSFKKKVKTPQSFVWVGKNFPLTGARGLFLGLSLFSFVLLVYQVRKDNLIKKVWRESEKIDSKYGSHFIPVAEEVNATGKTRISLKSFQSLWQIAEERELPIFRFCSDGFKVVYFVLDGDYLYSYFTKDKFTEV